MVNGFCIYGGVLEMKAAYIMLFGYITMIGIPVLLMLSSFLSPFSSIQILSMREYFGGYRGNCIWHCSRKGNIPAF